jgi:hypothetical protein
MSMSQDRPDGKATGEPVAFPSFHDHLYFALLQRLSEFVAMPLALPAVVVRGVVRKDEASARVFLYDGSRFATTIGFDLPLVDAVGEQIPHPTNVVALRKLAAHAIGRDPNGIELSRDSHNFAIFDARNPIDDDAVSTRPTPVPDIVYGPLSALLGKYTPIEQLQFGQDFHLVGFLTLNEHAIRYYFRMVESREVLGLDFNFGGQDGQTRTGTFFGSKLRGLISSAMLNQLEQRAAENDEYCDRIFDVTPWI